MLLPPLVLLLPLLLHLLVLETVPVLELAPVLELVPGPVPGLLPMAALLVCRPLYRKQTETTMCGTGRSG